MFLEDDVTAGDRIFTEIGRWISSKYSRLTKNKVQVNLGHNVGDIATRYDPPRRGRVNPNGGLQKKPSNIQGDSLLRLVEGLSPEAA